MFMLIVEGRNMLFWKLLSNCPINQCVWGVTIFTKTLLSGAAGLGHASAPSPTSPELSFL